MIPDQAQQEARLRDMLAELGVCGGLDFRLHIKEPGGPIVGGGGGGSGSVRPANVPAAAASFVPSFSGATTTMPPRGTHLMDTEMRLLASLLGYYEAVDHFAELHMLLGSAAGAAGGGSNKSASSGTSSSATAAQSATVSLRDLEFVVVRHPLRNSTLRVPYVSGGGGGGGSGAGRCTLREEYDAMNKRFHRTLFDVFARARESGAPRVGICFWRVADPSVRVFTVVKQLHFLQWASQLGIVAYILDHKEELRHLVAQHRRKATQARHALAARRAAVGRAGALIDAYAASSSSSSSVSAAPRPLPSALTTLTSQERGLRGGYCSTCGLPASNLLTIGVVDNVRCMCRRRRRRQALGLAVRDDDDDDGAYHLQPLLGLPAVAVSPPPATPPPPPPPLKMRRLIGWPITPPTSKELSERNSSAGGSSATTTTTAGKVLPRKDRRRDTRRHAPVQLYTYAPLPKESCPAALLLG